MKPSNPRRVVVFAVVAMLVGAAALGGTAVAQEAGAETADDVYVSESGDAVVVYEAEQADETYDDTTAEYGVDVDEDMAYALLETVGAGDGSVTAHFTSAFAPGAFAGEGNISAPNPEPEMLESMSIEMAGVTNDEESSADVSLAATLANTGGMSMFLESASTNGSVTMGADRLQAQGQFEASMPAIRSQGGSLSVSLTEQDGTYTAEVAQERHVSEFVVDDWQTREAARAHLESQFLVPVRALGGEGSLTIDEYALEEIDAGDYRLDLAYTVTVENVEDRLEDLLATQLSSSGEVSPSQARNLSQALTAVSINEVSVSYDVGDGSATGSATIDVENYADLLQAYFDVADDLDSASPDALQALDRASETFAAQRAAGMEYEVSWAGEVAVGEQTTIDAEYHQSATNWGAYVDELEARDLPTTKTRFDLSAATSGDRIEANGSLSVSGERIVARMIDRMRNASDLSGESLRLLQGVEQAGLQKAKLRADYGENLTVEAGASFEDLGALRDAIVATGDAPAFDSIVGETGNDTGMASYVRIPGAIDGEVTESAVRDISGVGEETTIHMPGTWDREFPTMDTERADDFLELGSGVQAGATASGSGPGFGLVAGLLAVLGVALLARIRPD